MRRVVLAALLVARLANVCAQRTNRFYVNASPGHGSCGQGAYLGAIDVKRDAFRHLCHLTFMKTTSGAMVASRGAGIAGLNAGVEWLMRHLGSPEQG